MPLDSADGAEPLTMKEMVAQSGISEHALRYYEKIGLIKPIPRDTSSGHRRYSPDTAFLVESLACLRASGLSIQEMRRYVTLREQGEEGAAEQKALLEAHALQVEKEIERLRVRQRYLAGKIAYWEARIQGDDELACELRQQNRKVGQELKVAPTQTL